MSTTPSEGKVLARFGIQTGPRTGEEVPVPRAVATIGQGSGNDLVLDDDSVSTRHARLEVQNGAWRITDLHSTNGTFVEDVRLAPDVPTPLPYGASVRFGGVRLHFRPAEDADLETAEAEYAAPTPPPKVADRRAGLRIPVWLVALILVLIVAAAVVYFFGAGPEATADLMVGTSRLAAHGAPAVIP